MNIYYVDPVTKAITPSAEQSAWREGTTQRLPNDQRRLVKHDPSHDLYREQDDTVTVPPYHTSEPALAFDEPNSVVIRTNTPVPYDIDQLYDTKLAEVSAHAEVVALTNAQSQKSGQEHIFVRTEMLDLIYYCVAGVGYADRHKDRSIGKDSSQGGYNPDPGPDPTITSYWARDIDTVLVNGNNGQLLVNNANELEWSDVLRAIYEHILGTREARRTINDELKALYDANDYAGLEAYDVPGSPYWPPTYTGPVSATARVI